MATTTAQRQQNAFGARLRAAREAKGLSLGQLARQIGLDKGALSRLETGQRRGIRLSVLAALAAALGLDGVDLLEELFR